MQFLVLVSVVLHIYSTHDYFFIYRKDNLDEKRFPYNDIEAFKRVVSLTGPQESLVDFLKPFPEVVYIIRYVSCDMH